ncbi:MAG TPA: hypothetical protein VLJ76_06615 [Gaiellaceae bacterium]|nr:hypothetical protein [Gaiellaceae bacterium]
MAVAGVVTAVLFVTSTLGGTAGAPPTAGPALAAPTFPSPPAGSLVLARQDRDLAIGLAVSRHAGSLALQASVIGQEQPASGLSVSFHVPGTAPVPGTACGAGCYRAVVDATSPRTIAVAVRRPNRPPSSAVFALPQLPAPPAAALVRRVEKTWRSLRTLVNHDRLSSGPGSLLQTVWRFQAPYRLSYRIENGPAAVAIGSRRWDKVVGGGWQESQQDPIRQPIPLWVSATDAHLLGSATLSGRPVWKVSFFDPQLPAWFTLWVEKATMRTLKLDMIAQAHFMHELYGPFNSSFTIVPPGKST